MENNELNTELKILEVATNTFLTFGYHATILHRIADKAAVNTAAIHYYFRSKERLYLKVVENILDIFQKSGLQFFETTKRIKEFRWFFFTELYNNKELFEKKLQEIYPDDWERNLTEIKNWLDKTTK